MALEETGTLDIVFRALDDRENGIDLMLFDHGKTDDESQRYTFLTKKLSTYIAYVMSDEFRSRFPRTKPDDVLIRVLCKKPPTQLMQAIRSVSPRGDRINRVPVRFENLDEFVEQAGINQ